MTDLRRPKFRLAVLAPLLALLAGVIWFASVRWRSSSRPPDPGAFLTNALRLLHEHEERALETYWAPEMLAAQHGLFVEKLWDELNAGSNRFARLARLSFGELIVPQLLKPELLPHRIQRRQPAAQGTGLSVKAWASQLETWEQAGWRLLQCEFRHNAFWPATNSQPARSRFDVSGHLVHDSLQWRTILEGAIQVSWASPAAPETIDASQLELRTIEGPPAFREVLLETVAPVAGSYFIDPLILWDLNRDGLSEIILAARNLVYARAPDGTWTGSPLCADDPRLIFHAIMGDFSGNGTTDFLCAKFDGLFLHEGGRDGLLAEPGRLVWQAQPRLKYAQALTAGDIDGDGDLDLFLGQYKVPYDKGQMPKPYFDANDGHPSFLLANDSTGRFADITQQAGLAAKRGRRVYSASWVDLDSDRDLDLVTISDFAGLDAWENRGGGKFVDGTARWFDQTKAFGMAHALTDLNADGRLDLVMIGMNSPTADRLGNLGLRRPYDLPDDGWREALTYGNRVYFGQPDGTFRQNQLGAQLARTGWSWGCAAADLDNDGWPDLYIGNGHETRQSVREYEPEFWLHDIYVGDSTENALALRYFQQKHARTRGQGHSYGGYEKNRLFLNLGGTNFVEAAHLLGLALEADARNVAAEDLDGDGKLDLVVTTFEGYPAARQTLRIFRNELPATGQYFEALLANPKAVGQTVRIEPHGARATALAGESYRTQYQPKVRFGLGAVEPAGVTLSGEPALSVPRTRPRD